MRYSIVIPVFNKAELTRACLEVLPASIADAGEGEVIVVDNASTDATAEMLRAFPWVKVIRNAQNLGFAGANNQGAELAGGDFLVLLNNDTQPRAGWLHAMLAVAGEPGVGAVGARLLFPDGSIQHAGVVIGALPVGGVTVGPYHHGYRLPADHPDVTFRREYQVVTGACLVTPRALYRELGGLDEGYWNGYEDVDYCFKVRARGLRVVYEPAATVVHYESQSGTQRFRKLWSNIGLLDRRWSGKVAFDAVPRHIERGTIRFVRREGHGSYGVSVAATPPTTVIVHGEGPGPSDARLRAGHAPVERVVRCSADDALQACRDAMAVRGQRYLAFVRADTALEDGWLDELIAQVEVIPDVAAATFAPELPLGPNVASVATDARCTLLALARIPQHLEVASDAPSLDVAVAGLLRRTLALERGTRGVARAIATVGQSGVDASAFDTRIETVEAALRARAAPSRTLTSIVTLSWNAPTFTKGALTSIRAFTSEPYEVIVVDNGSGSETRAMLEAIDDPHVRVIYNATNRGFAGGNNDGIAAARGEHVVLLNNDVIVTAGWLDGLLDPFARIPTLGVSAPRSNKVAGHQLVPDARYGNEAEMHAFAAERRERLRRTGYLADRAIGLCLCVDRTVIDQIGGFDESFEIGNFEDDDFCLRVRAAGYDIYVCDDVFVHHFGSQTFAANNVDYAASMHGNWQRFAQKWGFPSAYPTNGYTPRAAFSRGFDRRLHYAPIARAVAADPLPAAAAEREASAALTLAAAVADEAEWERVAAFAGRYLRAFRAHDPIELCIATFGTPVADVAARRLQRVLRRSGVSDAACANVEVADEDDRAAWEARMGQRGAVSIGSIDDSSPSGLRRLLAERRR